MRTVPGPDGLPRCEWALAAPDFLQYHDTEWGFPVASDRRLFEKLSLEAFQSGLSWRTILAKRENFRAAFANFEIHKVASFDNEAVSRLLKDAGIVRHRGKIEAVINNARRVPDTIGDGTLAGLVWSYASTRMGVQERIATTTDESVALAKHLKQSGWKFVGPTTVYAFMQAMGLVNDHVVGCATHQQVELARTRFEPPAR